MQKHIVVRDTEIEVNDFDPIERMRHIDKDGDGVPDYIDSNGYSKPNDKYNYREISHDDYDKLRKAGFDIDNNCRPSKKEPAALILRYREEQTAEIDDIIKPVLHRAISK